jgi:V/A-type H+-transporting ATPase subunit I
MCLGDAGYGIILIILGFLLRKVKGMSSVAPLVSTLGAATLVVGTILHTFFGIDTSSVSWMPDFIKKFMITGKIAGYDAQMVSAVIIGIVHLCLAITLKTVYAVKQNGLANSLGEIGWCLLIVGGVTVGGISLTGVISSSATKTVIIVLGSISALGIFIFNDLHRNPLANFGIGVWNTYNTATGLLGDTLSYLRLYALGLAGGMLGNAFNALASTMIQGDHASIVGWAGFILILIFGHTLNLAMSCLGAFVHPLRLNFLEFFKNSGYVGQGREYKPLQ